MLSPPIDLKLSGRVMQSLNVVVAVFATFLAIAHGDNFCRTQSDFQPNAVATGTTTCLELSTFLLDKFNPVKPAWSSVSCTETWTAAWRDTPDGSIKSIAEHLGTFGTACCGSAHKTLLGNTCHGCENAVPGTVVNRMGWFTATGATTSSAVTPGTVAPAGGGSYCGWSAAPPSSGTCNVSSWTGKRFGDTPAAATYSTCGPCEVIISKTGLPPDPERLGDSFGAQILQISLVVIY